MIRLFWDPKAYETYNALMDPQTGLPFLQRVQLTERIDALRGWPPSKWYDLRNRTGGTITFQMETDQFLEVLGLYENGAVKITHLTLKTKKGD